jgi:hypothetical protein
MSKKNWIKQFDDSYFDHCGDMDVNEHERLSNITPRHKLK